MKSADRTLLASLGFADKDKSDRRHDLACQFLAQRDVLATVLRTLQPDAKVSVTSTDTETHIAKGEGKYKTTIGFADLTASANVTVPYQVPPFLRIALADEDVRKHHSFADALISAEQEWDTEAPVMRLILPGETKEEAIERRALFATRSSIAEDVMRAHAAATSAAPRETVPLSMRGTVLVEVKIHPVSTGEIIRQLRLYREHAPAETSVHCALGEWDSVFNEDWAAVSHVPFQHVLPLRDRVRGLWSRANSAGLVLWTKVSTIVATAFPLAKEDVATLAAADIRHIRLGPKFEAYVASRQNESAADSPEF